MDHNQLQAEAQHLQNPGNAAPDGPSEFSHPCDRRALVVSDEARGTGRSKERRGSHKPESYWVMTDHLGGSNYITNGAGTVTQTLIYLPFGETLDEQHLNSPNDPWRYNGKELDAETGNYYYGARYYDPKTAIWLSVDPLSEMMPEWSSYAYAFNNPILYSDPTGLAPEMPPVDSDLLYWEDEDGISTRNSSDDDWDWDKGDGSCGTYPNVTSENEYIYKNWSAILDSPSRIKNESTKFINYYPGNQQDLGAIGTISDGYITLPQNQGTWNDRGSDGRQWIGCMACHGSYGAYNRMSYNSPSRFKGLLISATFEHLYGISSAYSATRTGVQSVSGTATKARVQFGNNPNQTYHAFRHTDELGLSRSQVQSAILTHFETVSNQVVKGKAFNQVITVGGHKLQYTAYLLENNLYNIGRIHGF